MGVGLGTASTIPRKEIIVQIGLSDTWGEQCLNSVQPPPLLPSVECLHQQQAEQIPEESVHSHQPTKKDLTSCALIPGPEAGAQRGLTAHRPCLAGGVTTSVSC